MKQCARPYLVVCPRQLHARLPCASHATSWLQARYAGSVSNQVLSTVLAIGASLMLVLGAVLTWPYSYFQLLRVVVFGCSAYLGWLMLEAGRQGWTVALVAVALLFNPFLPVGLSRGIWQIVDIAISVVMIFAVVALNRAKAK
jgi:apolipoprotein N-acyltransferase